MANPFQRLSTAFPGLGLNSQGFSNSAKKLGITLLVSLTTGCLSLFIGQAQALGAFAHWRSLGKPPEQAVKIVATALNSVTVETVSKKDYKCEIAEANNCWSETKEKGSINNLLCSPPDKTTKLTNEAIDFQQACYRSPGEYTVSAYALRQNGNIYVWEQTTVGEWIWVVLLFEMLAGGAVGFLGTLAFFFLRWIEKGV